MNRFLLIGALGLSFFLHLAGCTDNDPRAGEYPKYGETVAEVEKKLGPPRAVLPQMGNELRMYKAKSGTAYAITFDGEGKVIDIK